MKVVETVNRCTNAECNRPKDDKRHGPCCICVANKNGSQEPKDKGAQYVS